MIEKTFVLWDHLPEPIKAAVVAFVVALIRVMYDDREPRMTRRLLEASLCGSATEPDTTNSSRSSWVRSKG